MAVALYMVVEGDTEERFANQVLVPHLAGFRVCASVSKVITRGRRGRPQAQGGGRTYGAWRRDLTTWIKQQRHRPEVWFTTMLDLYGLGAFVDGFPGYESCGARRDPQTRVAGLEQAWGADIDFPRFLPHLQLHEFEALLLVDVGVLRHQFIEQARQVDCLVAEIAETGQSPEQIDDGLDTAPSKRIIRHVPQYDRQKATAGPAAAREIGLPRLRAACPHFDALLERLERLGSA